MALTLRKNAGRRLTVEEMDDNLEYLESSANLTFLQSGIGAIADTVQNELRQRSVNVIRYIPLAEHSAILSGTSTTDLTTYIQAAIDAVETGTGGPRSIYFPAGLYKITGTLTMTRGTALWGEGTTGSTIGYGTWIIHAVNDGIGLLWNGNDATSAVGTGGGVYHINVAKADGFTGGDAVKVIATDDNHRPGEMSFDNVLVLGEGSATWARGFHGDGTACTTAGSKGVRTLHFRKFRVADCTTSGQAVYLNQCVHVFGDIEIDAGDGTADMTIAGDSTDYHLIVRVGGTLTITDSTTDESATGTFRGEVGTFDNNNEDLRGIAELATTGNGSVANASKDFRVISNAADSFHSVLTSSTTDDKTGDNTIYTFVPTSETYDKNNSFNAATGELTAKCAGTYIFSGMLSYRNMGSGHVTAASGIRHRSSSGTELGLYTGYINPFAVGTSSGANFEHIFTAVIELAEGDRVTLQAQVAGSTKTVGIRGNIVGNGNTSWFSGRLLA